MKTAEASLEIKKEKMLVEGGSKTVYSTTEPDVLVLHFKDDLIASSGKSQGNLDKKGLMNARFNAQIYPYLESYHVQTHWIESFKPGELLVKSCEMIPLVIIMHNEMTDALMKNYGLAAGTTLQYPVLEFHLKNRRLKNPLLNADHACAFGMVSSDQIQSIDNQTRKMNAVLKSFFKRRDLILVNARFEFGLIGDQIVLADEISLDTCRFWRVDGDKTDKKTFDASMDKQGDAAWAQFEEMLQF